MSISRKSLRFAPIIAMLFPLGIWGLSSSAQGQQYLEELEKVIKKRSEQPLKLDGPQPEQPKAEKPQAEKPKGGNAEELPSPNPVVKPPVGESEEGVLSEGDVEMPDGIDPEMAIPTSRVFLGIDAEDLLDGRIGVMVAEVTVDSPAWKAGFQNGDRILGVDGIAVRNLDEFSELVASQEPGKAVKFLVERRGRNREMVAVLQDRELARQIGIAGELDDPISMLEENADLRGGNPWLGCTVADLSETWRRQFNVPAYRGAAVSEVVANSPAERAGLKPGDVIIEINGRAIESARQLTEWIAQSRPGTPALITYFRGVTPKQIETTVGAIVGAPNPIQRSRRVAQPIVDPTLPVETQIELLQAELEAAQQRLIDIQQQLETLQRQTPNDGRLR